MLPSNPDILLLLSESLNNLQGIYIRYYDLDGNKSEERGSGILIENLTTDALLRKTGLGLYAK